MSYAISIDGIRHICMSQHIRDRFVNSWPYSLKLESEHSHKSIGGGDLNRKL